MKKLVFIAFVTVLVVALSGIVVGKEAKPVKPDREGGGEVIHALHAGRLRPKRPDGVGMSGRSTMNRNREKYMEGKLKEMGLRLESQVKAHEAFVGQLEEIKKIAAGEKAKKTVAKIQELIDKEKGKLAKKEKVIKKEIEAFKTRMEQGFRHGPGTQRGGGQRPPKGKYSRSGKGAFGEVQKGGDKGVGEKK